MLQRHISQYSPEELDVWVRQLVEDKTPESMTIEYKTEMAFSNEFKLEIAKDISAFANTKGGIIIYGISEQSSIEDGEKIVIPSSEYGIEAISNFTSRLENILIDTISPHLPDLWIREVKISTKPGKVVYIVWHPESWLCPHMVQGYRNYRYYRRGLLRTVIMTEPEIRDAYIRVHRSIESVENFIDSPDTNYIRKFFPSIKSISHVISCPLLLSRDRVDFINIEMREWLRQNIYPQSNMSPDKSGIIWYPSLHGVQAGMTEVQVTSMLKMNNMYYWIELHRNGSVNVLWRTRITEKEEMKCLAWQKEYDILGDFVSFCNTLYSKINYFGPLFIKYTISNLGLISLKISDDGEPQQAQLPNDTFTAKLIEDSGKLIDNPKSISQALFDRLFQSFGIWQAPNMTY